MFTRNDIMAHIISRFRYRGFSPPPKDLFRRPSLVKVCCPKAACDQSALLAAWQESPAAFQPCRRPGDVNCYMAFEVQCDAGRILDLEGALKDLEFVSMYLYLNVNFMRAWCSRQCEHA